MNKIKLLLILLPVLFACEKQQVETEGGMQSLTDNVYSESVVNNISQTVNEYGLSFLSQKLPLADSGVTVTITPQYPLDLYPKTLIINYGSGIQCSDGLLREGKIIITFNNKWQVQENQVEITADINFNSFSVDNIQVVGNILFSVNAGRTQNPVFSCRTTGLQLNFSENERTSFSMEREIIWESGYNTLTQKEDDIFRMTGSATGVDRKGKGYESEIKTPLVLDNSCSDGTIVSGELQLTPQGSSTLKADFGNGSCDRILSLTVNGVTTEVPF